MNSVVSLLNSIFLHCDNLLRRVKLAFWRDTVRRKYGFNDISIAPPVRFIFHPERISIGSGTTIGINAVLTSWTEWEGEKFNPHILIGKNCRLGDYIHITSTNRIEIGDDVLTGRWVTISDNNHGSTSSESLSLVPVKRRLTSKGPVIIGSRVWIGDKSTILSGVTIGEGSVIGANSVVTTDIPPYSVAVGNPAIVIKTSVPQH